MIAYDPFVPESDAQTQVSLVKQEELFSLSDVISIHLPLTDETRDLINEDSFNLMRTKSNYY